MNDKDSLTPKNLAFPPVAINCVESEIQAPEVYFNLFISLQKLAILELSVENLIKNKPECE